MVLSLRRPLILPVGGVYPVLRLGGTAAVPWYLSGSIPAANCLAAYTPKGAASLAASYNNDAAPGNGLPDGTYDAATGVAPTWASATGWTFNGSSQYLTTGVTPASGYSMIVQFSDADLTQNGALCGEYQATNNARFEIWYRYFSTFEYVVYASGVSKNVIPSLAAGNLCIAGQQGYRNGTADGTAIAAWGAGSPRIIWIGALNNGAGGTLFGKSKIQALAIYNTTLTPTQVGLISSAMSSL